MLNVMLKGLPKAYEVQKQILADLLTEPVIDVHKIIIKLTLAESQLAPHGNEDDSVHALSSRDSVVCHHCGLSGHVVRDCQSKAAGYPPRSQLDSYGSYSSSRGGYGGDSRDRGHISSYSAPRGDGRGGDSRDRGRQISGYSPPRGSGGGYRGSYPSAPNRSYGGGVHVQLAAPRTFARRADTDRTVAALTATAISGKRNVVVMSATVALPRTPEPDVSNDGSPPPTLVGYSSDDDSIVPELPTVDFTPGAMVNVVVNNHPVFSAVPSANPVVSSVDGAGGGEVGDSSSARYSAPFCSEPKVNVIVARHPFDFTSPSLPTVLASSFYGSGSSSYSAPVGADMARYSVPSYSTPVGAGGKVTVVVAGHPDTVNVSDTVNVVVAPPRIPDMARYSAPVGAGGGGMIDVIVASPQKFDNRSSTPAADYNSPPVPLPYPPESFTSEPVGADMARYSAPSVVVAPWRYISFQSEGAVSPRLIPIALPPSVDADNPRFTPMPSIFKERELIGFRDSDYVGCVDTRRSTTPYSLSSNGKAEHLDLTIIGID
jgi:hypothetical protein